MFQFRRFPTYTYLIQCTLTEYCSAGFPHSEIHGSMDICSSPWLIAACHVLHRLPVPRHSPCALSSLTCGVASTAETDACWPGPRENLVLFLRIMQAREFLWLPLYLPCTLSGCLPHNFFPLKFPPEPLCCLTCHFLSLFSFQGAIPTSFKVRNKLLIPQKLISKLDLRWWARVGSNHRPYDYQSYALAS